MVVFVVIIVFFVVIMGNFVVIMVLFVVIIAILVMILIRLVIFYFPNQKFISQVASRTGFISKNLLFDCQKNLRIQINEPTFRRLTHFIVQDWK
jgi:hypothetical protein